MMAWVLALTLQDAEEWVRRLAGDNPDEAARRILEFGEKALVPLQEALDSDDIDVRERAADLIGRIRFCPRVSPRHEADLGPVFADLGHCDPERRVAGIQKLMKLPDRGEYFPLLRLLLHDGSFCVAQEAMKFLAEGSLNRSHIDGLISMLGVAPVERDAGRGAADVLRHLLRLLLSEDANRVRPLLRSTAAARLAAQVLLLALGDRSGEADLLRGLEGPAWKLRLALHGISISPPKGSAEALRRATLDSDDVRALAALANTRLGETVDPKDLAGWSWTRDPRIAGPARIALGLRKDEEQVKAVLKLEDHDEELWYANFEMVVAADRPTIYEALLSHYVAGGFHLRAFPRLPWASRDCLLRGLYPIWSRTPPKAARTWDILYQMETCSTSLKDLAAKTLSDPNRTEDQESAAILILRSPLTSDQEKALRAALVRRISSDPRRVSSLPHEFRIPELAEEAREKLRTSVESAWVAMLARHGGASDLELLRRLDPGTNSAAARAILSARARLKDPEVVDGLLDRLKDPSSAQDVIGDLEAVWSPTVAKRLRDGFDLEEYREARYWVLVLFHHVRDASLVPAYRTLLESSEFSLRIQAAGMAGEWRDAGAKDLLNQMRSESDDRLRLNALESLAKLGDRTVASEVLRIATDAKHPLRTSAIGILGHLATPVCVETLLRIALHDTQLDQGKALEALLAAGVPESRDAARLILETGSGHVGTALSVLQRFGELKDEALLRRRAADGMIGAFLALDAILNRAHYPTGSARKEWYRRAPLDVLTAECAKAYGVRITLSDGLRARLPYRWEPVLWGELDLLHALGVLTRTVHAAPITDDMGIRLVTLEEAIHHWQRCK